MQKDALPSGTSPRPRRVLLAEDDEELRALLARSLRHLGYLVVECRHGLDLLGQIDPDAPCGRELDFDLIISDIRMPGITGLSLLEGLQQWGRARPLPIILITAFGDEATHARVRELGAAATFDKPFDIDELMLKACQIAPPAAEPLGSRQHLVRRPRVLLAEDDEELRALVVSSLQRERCDVTECVDGFDLLCKLGAVPLFGEPPRFDLVISDIRMPGVTALEVLTALRDDDRVPPVILITAFGGADTDREAEALGAMAILDKPFDVDDLMEKARELLSLNPALRPLPA